MELLKDNGFLLLTSDRKIAHLIKILENERKRNQEILQLVNQFSDLVSKYNILKENFDIIYNLSEARKQENQRLRDEYGLYPLLSFFPKIHTRKSNKTVTFSESTKEEDG